MFQVKEMTCGETPSSIIFEGWNHCFRSLRMMGRELEWFKCMISWKWMWRCDCEVTLCAKVGNEARAHHELTHGLIQIRTCRYSISKILIRIHTDPFPQVTCLNRSGTCNMTGHPQIIRYLQVPKGIHGYLLILV